jgi:hypothetical protein
MSIRINEDSENINDVIINLIYNNTNTRSIEIYTYKNYCDIYEFMNYCDNIYRNFDNKIALLQNLSNISILGDDYNTELLFYKLGTQNIKYIYEDNMIILNFCQYENIPLNIKNLNIIGINENNFCYINNLPETIENLHLSSKVPFCFDKINLPINLKILNLDITNFYHDYSNYNGSLIKLPYGCKLEIKHSCI